MSATNEPTTEQLQEIWAIAKRAALKYGAALDEAELVAQETTIKFLTAWDSAKFLALRNKSNGGEALLNYAASMARNQHFDQLRGIDRRLARERRAADIVGEPLQERPSVHRSSPTEPSGIERYIARQAVIDMTETLRSRKQRNVMRAHYLEGLSINQISERLDLEPQTVRYHLRNALEILRSGMESGDDG